MNLRLVVVLLLSLLLSTSSFSLVNRLNALLTSTEYTLEPQRFSEQYLLSLKLGLPEARYQQLKELEYGSATWRTTAQMLARKDAEIAWQLAQFYKSKSQQRNHQYWFNKSLELGSTDALIASIKLNLQGQTNQDDYLKAKAILTSLINSNEEALLLSSHLAIQYNDSAQLSHNIALLNTTKGKQLLNLIQRYKVFGDPSSTSHIIPSSNISLDSYPLALQTSFSCQNKIQFFATSIKALSQLDQHISSLAAEPFFGQQFCFSTPRFIAESELNCSHSNKQRIECDESIWQKQGLGADVKYLGVLVKSGGANVNHGILYVDQQDTQQVIEHELMHLLGFVDEYSLHANHDACSEPTSSPIANNVLLSHEAFYDNQQQARAVLLANLPWRGLIAKDTPLTAPVKINNTIKYKIGTPKSHQNKVGLFAAKTCNKQGVLTFKPLHSSTKLEYFEEDLPKEYQQLSLNADDNYNMPSYQYNIGLALILQKQQEQAQQWFVKSAQLETDQHRQKVISQGGF